MPRTSPVHYIAPSAISVVPNANNSENDLAINVVRGAKMKLFSPKIPELDFVNNTFQEWTFAGRNRRLASSSAEYTVYGRLSKTDKKDGYLVFAPKVGGKDKYPYVTMDGLATDTAGYSTGNYWYVKLGDVSLPDASHKRTVTFDTGILGTDQFNTEWNLDPDDMPLRVLISCKIDGKDAGPTPYVPWDKTLDLQASLIEGWESETTTQADHWTIEPNTGATNWPDASRAASFAHSGHIILYHARENSSGTDDFAGQVSIPLTVTAWGKDDEGNDEVIGTAGITIFAETNEKYELVLSSSVMSYSPADGTYSPSEGIKVRIRAVDQKGDVFLLTKTQIDAIGLKASYAQSGTDSWTNLAFTGSGEAAAEATIETTAFAAQQNISVRLQNAADAELHSATVAFVKDGEDSKEREWIFLRSTEAITFTDDPQGEHPKPSVIEYGEVEPGDRAAGHVDNDKNQDGWVPEGWWDEMQGTDEDNRYEYGAYRDYVHDSEEQEGERRGHWGEFTNPVIWSYHAMDGMTYRCRWTLNGTEVWQLAAYTNGAFLGELPLTATLMRRKGSNNEEEVTGEADITVSFEGLSQIYNLHAQNPTFTISETENPEMIAHLNDANLMSITVNFTVGDETFSYNIPMLRRTEGESWWKYDPITDTVEFLKTISRAVIHNLNITGTFDAIKGYIDDLRSHNYSSGLLDGSGFRLTNDNGDGSSELEVDLLKVRKKATFMELEIREETFVGGNNHYSPAGSIIYRVEYMDENDEQLGYTVMKVPFLLKRFAFLGRVFNYAARKRVRRAMTDDEWKHVHHFRCYLLADDGTTATRNWWKVGDQPRCQTFNKAISSQNKRQNTYNWKKDHFNDDPSTPMPDFTTIEGPFETAYYWRLVSNVGSEKLDDGHVYDFIDMPYEGWNYTDSQGRQHSYTDNEKRSFRDGGSGIPVAGDTIVCIGNRTDEERMNVVSLYTSGNDNNPPAIKGYRGIHSFSFENCLVWEMSPEQFLVRSKAFKLLDDSGYQFPVPLERGEWQPGVRYHWYDRVSWIGNIWLCQVLDTYVWQNATGTEYQAWQVEDVQYGEGNFQYSVQGAAGMEADEILTGTDHYYRTGKVNGQTVYYIKLYTYSEPSKNNDLWLRQVSKGTEIVSTDIHYAATYDGLNHPADDAADWKTTIAATGVKMGMYLWTRTTINYDDPDNPDREPTREYSVSRWGIDGDGISEIDSYYLATSNTSLVINSTTDTYPKPGDSGWDKAGTQAKWYGTFGDAATANGGVGSMQGWNVWEKTVIKYDAYDDQGNPKTVPDLVNYRCSRIGQDGQIGQEEYYMLAASDDFNTVFGSATPAYNKVGIRWYNQNNPAAENWRLSSTTPNINTSMWSAKMPTYNKDTHGNKVYLWNFEQRVDGMGTEYATRPICIGNHARGIKGVIELYALSASQTPVSSSILVPADINAKNQYGVIPTSGFEDVQVWGDEKYERAPSEQLPYQWNWTRTLYSSKDDSGKDYEDHYHVSAVKGTKGEDGAGVEYVYKLTNSEEAPAAPANPTDRTVDDYVPDGWTDNPQGISLANQYEWVSERKSSATTGTGGFTGGHQWGDFSAPRVFSKWGKNGQDGDGVEYVFIRTANDTAPYITTSSDTYDGKTYLDDDYLPMSSAGRTTDDPTGPTKALPFEWVMQRTMGDPDAETGERQWHKYGEGQTDGKMSLWATFSESTIRLDLSNEMDMVQTDDKGLVTAERVVTTVVRLFDGTTEITLDPSKLTTAGGMTPYPKEQEGKGIKLTFRVTKNFTLASAMEITISYPYKNETYTAEMTIAPSMGQPIFQLSPSHSSLPCTRKADNTLNNPPALSLKIVKISGASSEEKDATSANLTAYGLTVRYSTTSMPSSASAGTAWPNGNSVQAATTDQNVHIAMFNSAGTLLDRETVPIIKDGENGQTAVRLDLDNENDSMLYDGRGTLVSGNVTATAYMFDGPTDVSGSTTFTISAREGVTAQQATISGRTVTVTGMTDAKAKVTVQGVYTDGQNKTHKKTSVMTLKKIVDGDKYDLVISPNAIPYNVTTDTPATSTISIQVFRTHIENGAAKRELSAPPSGYGVYAGSTALTASSTGNYSTTTDNSAIDSLTVKIAKSATSTDVLDIETIPIAKAKNGQGSFTSHVFKRQNTQPAAPTGGSYSSPVPSGWSDGVPDGTAIVWMSTRIFSSDGQAPQQDAWTTPRQMTDTADFDVEFSSYASPSAPTGHPNTNPQWGNTSDSTTIWMATSECHNGVWSDWQVAKIKGEKGADSTVPGPQGDQGKYEIKQFAISAYKKTDSEGTMPRDCSESSWQNTAPVTTSSKPYVWQRTKTYDPSTGVSTSWSYVRLTGEEGDDGSPGKTGLWYRFLGVYGVDCGPGTDTPVKNTETVGYYVKQDGYNNFYLNTLPADETNTNSLGGKGWESMNATFQYFITEALFGSYAHLGHFIINGQWMISQEGKYNGSYSDDYEDFTPGNFGKKNKFIPNFAVDGLSGKVYANDFMVNGVIRESGSYVSGTFVRINAGTDSESSEETRVTILDTKGLYSRGSQDGFRLIHSASGVQLQRWSPHGGAAGDWVPFYAGRAVRKITTTTELDMYDDYIIAGDGEFDVYLPESPSAGKVITVKNMQDGINIKTKGSDRIVLNNNAKNLTSKDLDSYDRAELVYYNHEWFWSYMET